MNFVAHAVVAGRERDLPAFAFGAMVPDLRRMARAPLELAHVDVAAGVAAHHRADAAFHASPRFKRWMADVVAAMPADTRGARAAAHVAVELAIDGRLLAAEAVAAYRHAVDWAGDAVVGPWATLVDHLRGGDLLDAYATPDGIAGRVVGIMRRRPRLVAIVPDAAELAIGVDAVLPSIERELDAVLDEISRA